MTRWYKGYAIEHFRHGYVVLVNGNKFYFDNIREAKEFIDEVVE